MSACNPEPPVDLPLVHVRAPIWPYMHSARYDANTIPETVLRNPGKPRSTKPRIHPGCRSGRMGRAQRNPSWEAWCFVRWVAIAQLILPRLYLPLAVRSITMARKRRKNKASTGFRFDPAPTPNASASVSTSGICPFCRGAGRGGTRSVGGKCEACHGTGATFVSRGWT